MHYLCAYTRINSPETPQNNLLTDSDAAAIVIEINYDLLCYVLIKFLLYIGRAEHTQQRTK